MADFDPILKQTFTFEGGYDANPADKGNYNSLGQVVGTNHGISAPLYEEYLKRPPTIADMKAITSQTAADLYRKKFWDVMPGDPFKSQSVAHIIFDGFVNSGRTMFKVVRKAINDFTGKETLPWNNKPFTAEEVKIINALPAEGVFNSIKEARKQFYADIIAKNPKLAIYKNGWNNRINAFSFSDVLDVVLFPANEIVKVITGSGSPKKKRRRVMIIAGTAIFLTGTAALIHHYRK